VRHRHCKYFADNSNLCPVVAPIRTPHFVVLSQFNKGRSCQIERSIFDCKAASGSKQPSELIKSYRTGGLLLDWFYENGLFEIAVGTAISDSRRHGCCTCEKFRELQVGIVFRFLFLHSCYSVV